MTPHGFIDDDEKALKTYKTDYAKSWAAQLGGEEFDIVEENESSSPMAMFEQEPQ